MKVTFIKHSSFLVELEETVLLFDYYEGDLELPDKPVYIFASHHHPDHFSPAVFGMVRGRDAKYILSNDIFSGKVPPEIINGTTFVSPNKEYNIGSCKIKTLTSTDLGVAFIVETEGKTIYHAGDLNCWTWEGAPEYQNREMKEMYLSEMKYLNGYYFDAAFVPLDPRLDSAYDAGMNGFLENTEASKIFPMHMWGDTSLITEYKKGHPQYSDVIADIQKEGQIFYI